MDWYMRMVQYVIQVQQLGWGLVLKRTVSMASSWFFLKTYYVFLDLEERFLLLLLNTPESIWWYGCYYGDVQTDLKSWVAPIE